MKFVSQIWVFCLFAITQFAEAIPFEKMDIKPGQRVGIYLGTMNPLSLGHMETVEYAVKSGLLVIVIPRDITLHKSGVYPYRIRQQMAAAVYENNPNVGYPTANYWLPNINGISRALKKKGAHIVGVVGQDILESTKYSWLNTTVMFGRVDEWLVAERSVDPNFKVPATFAGKPVKKMSDVVDVSNRKYTDASSTKIRKALTANPEFFTANKELSEADLPMDPRIQSIVRKLRLYAPEAVTKGTQCLEMENLMR